MTATIDPAEFFGDAAIQDPYPLYARLRFRAAFIASEIRSSIWPAAGRRSPMWSTGPSSSRRI